jgi:hypothetical protein
VILSAKLGSDHGLVSVWEAIRGMQKDISTLGVAVESGRKEVQDSSAAAKGTSAAVKTLASEVGAMEQRSTNLGLSLQN